MLTGNDVTVLMGFLASAITLAGFSGIITAIDRSVAPASSEVIAFRVHNLVVTAIYLTTLALLPVIIDALEVLPQTRWQFCTMIAAITVGWGISSAVSARMRMTSHTSRGISNFLFAVAVLMASAAIALNITATTGIIAGRGAYYFAQFHLLFLMLSLFRRMMLTVDEASREKSRTAQ